MWGKPKRLWPWRQLAQQFKEAPHGAAAGAWPRASPCKLLNAAVAVDTVDGHGLASRGPEGQAQGLYRRSTSPWDSCLLRPASAGTLRPASTGEPALVVLPAWAAPKRTNPCPYRHRLFRFATRDRPRPWPKSFAPTGLWPPTAPWRALSKRANRPCPEGALVKRAAQVVWFWTAQEREGLPPRATVSGTPEKPKGVDVVGPSS